MELLQTTLIIVLIILTICFVAVTVFLVILLNELKHTARRANLVLAELHQVSGVLSDPIPSLMKIASAVFPAKKFLSNLMGKTRKEK